MRPLQEQLLRGSPGPCSGWTRNTIPPPDVTEAREGGRKKVTCENVRRSKLLRSEDPETCVLELTSGQHAALVLCRLISPTSLQFQIQSPDLNVPSPLAAHLSGRIGGEILPPKPYVYPPKKNLASHLSNPGLLPVPTREGADGIERFFKMPQFFFILSDLEINPMSPLL